MAGTDSLRRRLLLGSLTNWSAFAATLLVGFFLTPYLFRKLGDAPYGIWAFVESLLAYLTLFDLGLSVCVVRYVAKHHATGERDPLNRLVSSTLAFFVLLAFGALCVGVGLIAIFLPNLHCDGLTQTELIAFAAVMLGNLVVTLPLSVFPSILDGLEKFAAKSLIRIAFLAVRTVGTVAIVDQSASLVSLALWITLINLAEHAAMILLAFRLLPGLQPALRFVDRATLREVRGYSLDAFLAMISGRVCVQSGPILVGLLFGSIPVAIFSLASRLIEFAKALLRTATNTLTPAVSSLDARGQDDAIRGILLNGTRWVLYLMLPVQLGLVIFGRAFLETWLNSAATADACAPTLSILSIGLSLVVAQSVASRILYGTGRLRTFARMTVVEAAANLGLSLALGIPFGLPGIAVGIIVPNVLMNLWVIGHTLRQYDLSWTVYLHRAWLRPTGLVMIPVAIWLAVPLPGIGWLSLISCGLAGLIPYGIAVALIEGRFPKRLRFPFVASSLRREKANASGIV
jgi:O-antigen/teichoic acid export membrane protein